MIFSKHCTVDHMIKLLDILLDVLKISLSLIIALFSCLLKMCTAEAKFV